MRNILLSVFAIILLLLPGCSPVYQETEANVLCVVKFKNKGYEDYVLSSVKSDNDGLNYKHMIYLNGMVEESVYDVSLKDIDSLASEDLYIPLNNGFFLVFPFKIMSGRDKLDDFILYNVKWSQMGSLDLNVSEYKVLDSHPLDIKKDIVPLKKHETLNDVIVYVNDLIDKGTL